MAFLGSKINGSLPCSRKLKKNVGEFLIDERQLQEMREPYVMQAACSLAERVLQAIILIHDAKGNYAVFFPAFTFAHRALCAAAIFRRAAADIVRLARIGTTFARVPAFSLTFAQRALWAAAILSRADADKVLVPVRFT
jgi:hypothetical protein